MPKVSNVEHYARIVKEKAILRNLIHTTHNIQQRRLKARGRRRHSRWSGVFDLALAETACARVDSDQGNCPRQFRTPGKIFRKGEHHRHSDGYTELDSSLRMQPSEL